MVRLFALLLLFCSSAVAQITQNAFTATGSGNGGSVSYDTGRQVVWFTVENASRLGKIDSSGTITFYTLPTSTSAIGGVDWNSVDDHVYVIEQTPNKIARFDPVGTTFQEFLIPEASSSAAGIKAFNGKEYFVESGINKVNWVDSSGTFGTPIAVGTFPHGPTVAPDDNTFRFCLFNGNQVGKIDTSGTYTAVNLPQSSSGCGVTTPVVMNGGVNYTCFTENGVNKIGCLPHNNETTGGILQFNIPSASSNSWGIATGYDGNVYFTERDTNKIGVLIVGNQSITMEYPLPNGGTSPNKICKAFGNQMVFTEHVSNNVDFLNTNPAGAGSKMTGTFTGTMQ